MTKPSVVHLSINTSLALEPFQLGIYVKGKALLAVGRRAFGISDIGGDKDLAREAIGKLMSLGLVEHRGGGWYALAKVPARMIPDQSSANLGSKMSSAAKPSRRSSQSVWEQLRNALKIGSSTLCGRNVPAAVYTITSPANKAKYRRIMNAVREAGSSVEEFIEFVFMQDWSWTHEGYPALGVVSTAELLSKFQWFLVNKDKIEAADGILDLYDKTFGYIGEHTYAERVTVLRLKGALDERGITVEMFFDYVVSLQWKGFGGFPPITFLVSSGFVNQAHSALHGRGQISRQSSETYLGRIVNRLERVSFPLSTEGFENCNWDIGEAIFEPLVSFANNSALQLKTFVTRVVDAKDEPSLGFYLVTYDGKLTPLAVYWIVYASRHIESSFCPLDLEPWKDLVSRLAAEAVNLNILETPL